MNFLSSSIFYPCSLFLLLPSISQQLFAFTLYMCFCVTSILSAPDSLSWSLFIYFYCLYSLSYPLIYKHTKIKGRSLYNKYYVIFMFLGLSGSIQIINSFLMFTIFLIILYFQSVFLAHIMIKNFPKYWPWLAFTEASNCCFILNVHLYYAKMLYIWGFYIFL